MKKLLTAVIIMLFAVFSYADTVEIENECVHLNEVLGDDFPAIGIQCGFQPGDQKILPAAVIQTALKRSAIKTNAEIPAAVTVVRVGHRLSVDSVHSELADS